jgi:Rrf2 family protein
MQSNKKLILTFERIKMTISTKGRYALRMIVDLALHSNDGFVTLKDIADRQEISKKYLEQIVAALNKGNILIANRGFSGGYKLAKSPDKITVGDILRLTEGNLAPVACVSGAPCERMDICQTFFVWQGLDKVINEYLDSVTVQDIIDKNVGGNDYCI